MSTDPLTPVLARLGVKGAVFSRAALAAPWGVSTRGAGSAIFHVVVRGAGVAHTCDAQGHPTGAPVAWRAGDVLLFPRGTAHVLGDQPGRPSPNILSLQRDPDADGLPCVRVAGGGAPTELLCGTLTFDPWGADLILPFLPDLLHVPGGTGETAAWLDATLRMLGAEVEAGAPGSEAIISRLSEVLFIQAVRGWAASRPAEGGWISALAHPGLAAALAAAHAEPAGAWTVARLARKAGMSRSAFAAAFMAHAGIPPATHLTRWRMALAREALARTDQGLAEIADSVGYASEASFIRAFVREEGRTPTRWRRAQARPEEAVDRAGWARVRRSA